MNILLSFLLNVNLFVIRNCKLYLLFSEGKKVCALLSSSWKETAEWTGASFGLDGLKWFGDNTQKQGRRRKGKGEKETVTTGRRKRKRGRKRWL